MFNVAIDKLKYSRVQNRAGIKKNCKKNEGRALKKRRAGSKYAKLYSKKTQSNLKFSCQKFQNLINVGPGKKSKTHNLKIFFLHIHS